MFTPLRVLILADQPSDAEQLVRELRRADFTPDWRRVDTGLDFLRALEPAQFLPHIILAGCSLDQIEGMAALRLLQARGLDIPFILICDIASEETIAACTSQGAAAVITRETLPHLGRAVAAALARGPSHANLRYAVPGSPAVARTREYAEPDLRVPYDAPVEPDCRVLNIGPAIHTLLGYSQEEWLADPGLWVRLLHPEDRDRVVERVIRSRARALPFHAEYRLCARDGRLLWVRDEATAERDETGRPIRMRGILRDITERKQAENRQLILGARDALTGLYNAMLFETELVRLGQGRHFPVSVLVAAVDDYQAIAETHSRDVGDDVLRRAAQMLRATFRADDMLAHLGGDEFALALGSMDLTAASHALARVRRALSIDNAAHPDLPLNLSLGAATAEQGERVLDARRQAQSHMSQERSEHRLGRSTA